MRSASTFGAAPNPSTAHTTAIRARKNRWGAGAGGAATGAAAAAAVTGAAPAAAAVAGAAGLGFGGIGGGSGGVDAASSAAAAGLVAAAAAASSAGRAVVAGGGAESGGLGKRSRGFSEGGKCRGFRGCPVCVRCVSLCSCGCESFRVSVGTDAHVCSVGASFVVDLSCFLRMDVRRGCLR